MKWLEDILDDEFLQILMEASEWRGNGPNVQKSLWLSVKKSQPDA